MAYKISKKSDAPEGDIKVSVGSVSFRVKDDEPYETDDASAVEVVQISFPEYFDVEVLVDEESVDPKGEERALKELHKEQEKAKTQHATKDVLEEAAPVPTSVADLKETDEQPENDTKAKRGNK